MKISILLTGLLVLFSASSARSADAPSAPDAQYTILCETFSGPGNALVAKRAKDNLMATSGLKDWYVVTGDLESNLYYGFYHAFDDPKDSDTARAQKDHKAVSELVDLMTGRPFRFCVFVTVGVSDPIAPPEWDLRNAKGYFSLEIAAYMDSPLRKQAAVDAVREARKMGVEAYYYHGEQASIVCIGAWPREAIKEQDSAVAQTTSSDEPIMVTAGLPNNFVKQGFTDPSTGKRVKVMTPVLEYVDKSLIEARQKYPIHSINGERTIRKRTENGKVIETEDKSFIVYIPAKQEVVKEDPALARKAVELGVISQPSAPKKGEGKLKSIGE